ncbi:MAG: NfeD family protein [Gammaproteobacteria bacterium]|nr:NfeD family protein [Gammaproteobacteria bacterium]
MSLDLISGLLLAAVVLFGAGYVAKQLLGDSLARIVAEYRTPPKPHEDRHLVGAVGRVVDDGERSGRMRVRVGMESWNARQGSSDAVLPVGTEVEVKAVDGRVLEVEPKAAET